jgi:hypothetical protein
MGSVDPVMIARLVERTGMRRSDVEAVVQELNALDGAAPAAPPGESRERRFGGYQTTEEEITALIVAAGRHRLGTEFLLTGHLGTVAIMFGVHAFTVEAARLRLRGGATG